MPKHFPKQLGLNPDNYPDITDDYEQLKLSLYDRLVSQGGQVAPVVINRLFVEKGPFDTRQLKQFPNPGEYARLNGQVVSPDELNHRLYGMALGATGYRQQPDIHPAHLNRPDWINRGVNAFSSFLEGEWDLESKIPPVWDERLPSPKPTVWPEPLPDRTTPSINSTNNNLVLKGGVSARVGLPESPGGALGTVALYALMLGLGFGLKGLINKSNKNGIATPYPSKPHSNEVTDNKLPRLPIEGPRGYTPSQLSARIEQAWQQLQHPQSNTVIPKSQTMRASWGQPIQGPPVFMAENTVTDLPDPDLKLLAQTQAPKIDPRLARLQQWQRLQAAQEQVNSITQPPASNIMGGRLRQTFETDPDEIIAAIKQQNLANMQKELLQLQLEQARLEKRTGKKIEHGYVSNKPTGPTSEEAHILWERYGMPEVEGWATLDLISLFMGIKEAVEIIKLLKYYKVPFQIFRAWLKQEFEKGSLKEALNDLLKVSRSHGFKMGAGGAKGVAEKTIRGINVKFEANQIKQKVMQHFNDFDWPKPYRDRDIEDILNHLYGKINKSDVVIEGTWRKKPCIHFYDSNSGIVYIIIKNDKKFETFFKLSPQQIEWLYTTGDLN